MNKSDRVKLIDQDWFRGFLRFIWSKKIKIGHYRENQKSTSDFYITSNLKNPIFIGINHLIHTRYSNANWSNVKRVQG